MKPANNKECVLIIDEETGEITLERLDGNIMLKKTRAEKHDPSTTPTHGGQFRKPSPGALESRAASGFPIWQTLLSRTFS